MTMPASNSSSSSATSSYNFIEQMIQRDGQLDRVLGDRHRFR